MLLQAMPGLRQAMPGLRHLRVRWGLDLQVRI